MTYEQYLLLRDPYEVSEIVRKALEPRFVQIGPVKITVVSSSGFPNLTALMWCGPEPEHRVWITGLDHQESGE
jgi:hypothetical protein